MTKYYYIAGPMSGIPRFNIPAFDEAASNLREEGYHIVSPAELDDPVTREMAYNSLDGSTLNDQHPNGESWGDFLARDVKIVADKVQGVIVLPGWERSRGARLEVMVALLCGHDLLYYNPSYPGYTTSLPKAAAAREVVREFAGLDIKVGVPVC
jgi:hypothetical protein